MNDLKVCAFNCDLFSYLLFHRNYVYFLFGRSCVVIIEKGINKNGGNRT